MHQLDRWMLIWILMLHDGHARRSTRLTSAHHCVCACCAPVQDIDYRAVYNLTSIVLFIPTKIECSLERGACLIGAHRDVAEMLHHAVSSVYNGLEFRHAVR